MKPVFLHVAARMPDERLWCSPFRRALAERGELRLVSDGAKIGCADLLAMLQEADVVFTGWGGLSLPEPLAFEPGSVRYICHLTGTMKNHVPIAFIQRGMPVTNWGDAPAFGIAEAAMTLLLASLKNLRAYAEHTPCSPAPWVLSGSLAGLRVGIYGLGRIARRFCELLRPFGACVAGYDPFAQEWTVDVVRFENLEALFDRSQAVVIHAGLNALTRGRVNADLLRRLPDGGIVVNTARGDIVDQDALFKEVESGRLRAALDVLAGKDWLPPEHPAHRWPNLILTRHKAGSNIWPAPANPQDFPLQTLHHVCLENLDAFLHGHPLKFAVDEHTYELST